MNIDDVIRDATPAEVYCRILEDDTLSDRLESLEQLERDTPCGEDCIVLIKRAADLLATLGDAEQDDEDFAVEVWARVIHTCGVYWNG